MATRHIEISNELYARLEAKAEVQGKTVDELAEDSLQESLNEKRWQDMFSINKRPAMTDDAIVDVVHDYRAGR